MINTASYSYAAQAYGKDVEKVVSLFEGFIGVGTTSGGVLGGLVYNSLGFEKTFYIFGGIFIPLAIAVQCLVRNTQEMKEGKTDQVFEGEKTTLLLTTTYSPRRHTVSSAHSLNSFAPVKVEETTE